MPANSQYEPDILYEKEPAIVGMPASMSKMLTALVILENISDLQTMLPVYQDMIELLPSGFYAGDFKAGDRVTV